MKNSDKHKITAEQVRTFLGYNAETGDLTWIKDRKNGTNAGDVAGFQHPDGYKYIKFSGFCYSFHRVVWLHFYGEWPKNQIDHINGVRNDNRIINLRDVSQYINMQNKKKSQVQNKSGFLGVAWYKKTNKYIATIQANGIKKYLGSFANPETAHKVYLEAKKELHKESFNMGNSTATMPCTELNEKVYEVTL